jgi:hypothetical protein
MVAIAFIVIAVLGVLHFVPSVLSISGVIGRPSDPGLYCTRSPECIPRSIFHFVLHWDLAAWLIGLAFRAAGAFWLLFVAWRASRDGRTLQWYGLALLVYYLYLHGWMQSWYLLPLLPLMPFADPRHLPAMIAACLCGVLYYAIKLTVDCDVVPQPWQAIGDVAEACLVLIPPFYLLMKNRLFWRRRAAGA